MTQESLFDVNLFDREKKRKTPQPHPNRIFALNDQTAIRLMNANLNLKNKGEISLWIKKIQKGYGFDIEEVFSEDPLIFFRTYFELLGGTEPKLRLRAEEMREEKICS